MSPSEALASLMPMHALSPAYGAVYEIYLRKFNRLMTGMKGSSAEGKALTKLCSALNIDFKVKEPAALPELLARLRAMDMIRAPP